MRPRGKICAAVVEVTIADSSWTKHIYIQNVESPSLRSHKSIIIRLTDLPEQSDKNEGTYRSGKGGGEPAM